MCVSSLKRLCLMRVHELDFPTDSLQDLPDTLVKELAKARLFCGNYLGQTVVRYGVDSPVMSQTCLSIRYDWIHWTFVFRSQSIIIPCCYSCDYIQPHLYTVSIKEHVSSPFFSPFSRTKNKVVLESEGNPPDIWLQVEMDEDAWEGVLTFSGTGGGGIFYTSRLIVTDTGSLKELCHRADITGRMGGSVLYDYLDDNEGEILPAELAFIEPVNRICTNTEWSDYEEWIDDVETEDTDWFDHWEDELVGDIEDGDGWDWAPLPLPDWENFIREFWYSLKL